MMSSQMKIKIVEEMNDKNLSDIMNSGNKVYEKPGM